MPSLRSRLKLLRQYLINRNGHRDHIIDQWYSSVVDDQPISLWDQEGKKKDIRDSIYAFVFDHIRNHTHGRVKQLSIHRPAVWLSAAVVAGLLFGGYLLYQSLNRVGELSYIIVSVPAGKIKEVYLPDSSHVWLKSGTTLRYRSDFNSHERQLTLQNGEAFFEVRKDPTRPFIVSANHLQTRVLGTAFLVQSYHDRPTTQVWVEHGRVQVNDTAQVLQVLTQHQRLSYDHTARRYRVDSLYWQQALAWQQGVLMLKSASFDELAAQFAEIYGIQLITHSAVIRRLSYDGKFFINTPPDDVLQLMTALHHIRYKREGNHILFY
jgi:ferric-dicitrate binding protein FerR (iron transport regulator)